MDDMEVLRIPILTIINILFVMMTFAGIWFFRITLTNRSFEKEFDEELAMWVTGFLFLTVSMLLIFGGAYVVTWGRIPLLRWR